MLKIVSKEDWNVLKKYLGANGVVLIPEDVLETFSEEEQAIVRAEANGETNRLEDYNFGGEAEIFVDIIHDRDSYAATELLGDDGDEDEG